MKKLEKRMAGKMMLCFGLGASLLFGGCGSETETDASDKKAETEQIANPWQDANSLEEAEKLAGFDLQVPETIEGQEISDIQVNTDEEINQVFYGSDDQILVRKGKGDEDISGDYTEYASVEEADLRSISEDSPAPTVTLKGADDEFILAVWSDNGFSYSVLLENAVPANDMLAIAAEIS